MYREISTKVTENQYKKKSLYNRYTLKNYSISIGEDSNFSTSTFFIIVSGFLLWLNCSRTSPLMLSRTASLRSPPRKRGSYGILDSVASRLVGSQQQKNQPTEPTFRRKTLFLFFSVFGVTLRFLRRIFSQKVK